MTQMPWQKSELEKARDDAIGVLNDLDPFSDEYKKKLKHVKMLSDLVAKEAREKLSMNTCWSVAGTVAAVLIMTDYEKLNVLTSKALQFLPKLMK